MVFPGIHYFGKKLKNPMFKHRVQKEAKKFSKDVQNLLQWYAHSVQDLEDEIKSGLHMGQLMEFIINTEKTTSKTTELENMSSNQIPCKGEILELGVFRGGTTICFAKILQKIKSKRIIYACDTFSGFPYSDTEHEKLFNINNEALKNTSFEYVVKKYEKFKVDKNIIPIKGKFENTLYSNLNNIKFSFVFSDSDLYKSTKYSLDFLKTRMCKDGIIAFHNYGEGENGIWGETDAVDEFCHENNLKLNMTKSIPFIQF